jgi:glutamyl-tRNA reductase
MHYLTISFTHKNTDISIREKLSFSDEEKKTKFICSLQSHPSINETIVLSTCNRVEIICSVNDPDNAIGFIFDNIALSSTVEKEDLEQRADIYEDNGAIHHLFSVSSSLDSLVIGETQIVGQLKDAFRFSVENNFCGQKLGRAMHYAFRCAATVRASTDISKNPISVSSVAVSKAQELMGSLEGIEVIVVGAGEMSTLAAKHAQTHGARVIIVNRNLENAQKLANELDQSVQIEPYSKLKEFINSHSVVFSATGAPHSVITDDMIEKVDFRRYWFDIAVPRDIEISETDLIDVYAVDDLEEIVTKNLSLREKQAKVAYSIVGNSTMEFFKWLQTLSVDPIIKELREKARACSEKELKRAFKKGNIPIEYKEEVEKILHYAFNSFLHHPTKTLKEVAERPESDTIVQSVQEIFNINDDVVKRINMYKCEYQMDMMEKMNEVQ